MNAASTGEVLLTRSVSTLDALSSRLETHLISASSLGSCQLIRLNSIGVAILHPLQNLVPGRVEMQWNHPCRQMERPKAAEQLLAQLAMFIY